MPSHSHLTRHAKRIGDPFDRFVTAQPAWMRPALYGAALLGALTLVRATATVLIGFAAVGFRIIPLIALAVKVTFLGALGGFAAGLCYSLIGKPLQRLPRIGPYATGVVTVAAYLLALVPFLNQLSPTAKIRLADPDAQLAFVITLALAGPYVGYLFFRPGQPGSLKAPREKASDSKSST